MMPADHVGRVKTWKRGAVVAFRAKCCAFPKKIFHLTQDVKHKSSNHRLQRVLGAMAGGQNRRFQEQIPNIAK